MTTPVQSTFSAIDTNQQVIKSVTATAGSLTYALKQIKKLEESGKLPESGQIPILSPEQASEIINGLNNSPNKPDCSTMSYLEKVIEGAAEGSHLDSFIKGKIFKMGTKESATEAVKAITYYYKLLKVVQGGLEGAINGYQSQERACSTFAGGINLVKQGTQETIATVEYQNKPMANLVKMIPPAESKKEGTFLHQKLLQSRMGSDVKEVAVKALQPQSQIMLDPQNVQNSSASLLTRVCENISGSALIAPDNLSQSVVGVDVNNLLPGIHGSFLINPLQLNQIRFPLSLQGIHQYAEVILHPNKLRNSQLNINGEIDKIQFGANISLNKPLNTNFSVHMPVMVHGIPLKVGVDGQLNRLDKLRLKLELPLDSLNKITSIIGIKFKSFPILSVSFKHIVNPIKKLFGRRKKHRHKNQEQAVMRHNISLVKEQDSLDERLIEAIKKLVNGMIALENITNSLNTNINALDKEVKVLLQNSKLLETSLATLENETSQLDDQVNKIASGPSLQNSLNNLEHMTDILQLQTTLLHENQSGLISKLQSRGYNSQMANQALLQLKSTK